MNFLRNIFKTKKLPSIIDPLIGKTVIHFTTHGCMGTIHEFDYVGKIIDVDNNYGDWYHNKKYYKVQILKDRQGELRDANVGKESMMIPSWYLQDLGGDFLVAYD